MPIETLRSGKELQDFVTTVNSASATELTATLYDPTAEASPKQSEKKIITFRKKEKH